MKKITINLYLRLLIALVGFFPLLCENNNHIYQLKGHGIEFVEFCFTDPVGNYKSITYPISMVRNEQFSMYVDGSSIKGCTRITESDLLLIPDWNTVRIKPVVPPSRSTTAIVMCNLATSVHMPYENDPRTILKKVLKECEDLGYRFLAGVELEFFIVQRDGGELFPIDKGTYFNSHEHPHAEVALQSLLRSLEHMELNPEKIHHEVAPGQYEISLRYDDALALADKIVLAKQTISQFIRQFGYLHATFMPKPFDQYNGSGMHIHFSLFDGEHNIFYNPEQPEQLSKTGLSFIAGVLEHAQELTLLFNPSINSYKRLVPGYEAPIYICCGLKNRSALIRIPLFDPQQKNAPHAELRSPDPSCNPYLVLAGILKAGLDGIKRSLCPYITEKNLYNATEKELEEHRIPTIPNSLEQAIVAFEKSVFMKNLIGSSLFETILKEKKQEVTSYQRTITNWEIDKYA